MKLSVVLATYNEENNIGQCLQSVRDLADEIIIVDGKSTDRTVEIAKQYDAKIIVTDNPPIFHINKQKAIDLATGDWILQLDADERVTLELKKEILSAICLPLSTINGYWIPRKNWFLGRFLMKGGQYPDYTLRLYRKGKGKLPCKNVHEQAIVDGEVGYLKNPLIHMADININRYLKRWDRYTNLLAGEIKDILQQQNIFMRISTGGIYLIIKPWYWFLLTYFRHKGFMDSWQGFVFSLFSAWRFPVAYIKYLIRGGKITYEKS
ncbi:MAG: glycosyltransferase family 2 protein [Candidatus Gottesmanbacteria bacterium]